MPWGRHIPANRVRAWDVHPTHRPRLGAPRSGEDGRWFGFDDGTPVVKVARVAVSYRASYCLGCGRGRAVVSGRTLLRHPARAFSRWRTESPRMTQQGVVRHSHGSRGPSSRSRPFRSSPGHESLWVTAMNASFVFWGLAFVIFALRWRSSSSWAREHFSSYRL
jgi:hypothetical protein